MSPSHRDEPTPRGGRTSEERERARIEREARRRADEPRPAPTTTPEPTPARKRPAAFTQDGTRVIQPDPPAPPAAPAGALRDETKPTGAFARAVRNFQPRTVVTPPADVKTGPRARRSVRARIRGLALLAVALILIYELVQIYQPLHGGGGAPVRVTIPQGASSGDIANQLESAGVIGSATNFKIRATISGQRSNLRPGAYTLRKDESYGAVLAALTATPKAAAPAPTVKVTIPEGRSRRETAQLVATLGVTGDYRRATRLATGLNPRAYGSTRRTLEGFLFPATYDLTRPATATQLVAKQLQAFKQEFATVDLRRAQRKNLTAYDVLTIASMVEREAQVARERPLIAAVIYNRLHAHMQLGIDATIRFATGNWTRPLTQSELAINSAYNTRKHVGLPPTPIGSPGLASIQAAAAPAKVPYLYYVVKPGKCGQHAFSSTNAKFQADVARYNNARAQQGGKSPTTC